MQTGAAPTDAPGAQQIRIWTTRIGAVIESERRLCHTACVDSAASVTSHSCVLAPSIFCARRRADCCAAHTRTVFDARALSLSLPPLIKGSCCHLVCCCYACRTAHACRRRHTPASRTKSAAVAPPPPAVSMRRLRAACVQKKQKNGRSLYKKRQPASARGLCFVCAAAAHKPPVLCARARAHAPQPRRVYAL